MDVPVNRIKVYLTGLDRLPRSILDSLLDAQEDIEVVGPPGAEIHERTAFPGNLGGLFEELQRLNPDVLIVGTRELHQLRWLRDLFGTRVLLLAERGKEVFCYQLRPDREEFGQILAHDLVELIREHQP